MNELTDKLLEMEYSGYSSHDCETWYKCPVCRKPYGSWGFFHDHLKAGDVIICECGAKLKVPR